MRKLPSRKILASLVAGALFLPNTGFTLGLGEIEVNSVLNQKLNADIELLSATPEDAETIIVKLASRQEFSRAGLDRPYSLNNLHFKAEVINDIPYIRVSSGVPIREPFLNFLIEVDWPNGHLLREYTILLDPPVFMTQSAGAGTMAATDDSSEFRPSSSGSTNVVPVVGGAPTGTGSFRPAAVSQPQVSGSGVSQTSTFIPAPVVQQQTPINQPAGSYRIKAGDTAWSLANAMRPDQSISVYQMMIAMLRANPESFINENVNGLKRGYILRVPDYNQIAAISDEDARALVREQAALWRQYQQSKAGGKAVSAMQTGDSASSEAGTGAGAAGEQAYLEIVSAGSGSSVNSGKDPSNMTAQELRAELALARERVETERVEKEALQQRVGVLEQHVEKMKGMLSIEDEELSRVQSLNLPAEDDIAGPVAEEMADEVTAEAGLSEPEEPEVQIDEVFEDTAEAGASEEPEIDEVFIDETNEQAAAEDQPDNIAAVPEKTTTAPVQPHQEPPAPADLLSQLLNDPVRLATAGGGLLLIATLIGLVIKRRKTASATQAENAFDDLEVLSDKARGEAATAEGQEDAVLESLAGAQVSDAGKETSDDEAKAGEAEAFTESEEGKPRDDIIAEADVYLAYGIYQQAEELLTNAINQNPDRNDYRLKLAETYYASKNADGFIETATDLSRHVDSDESPEWKKVVVMGLDLCPDNSMFQGDLADYRTANAKAAEQPLSETESNDDEMTLAENEDTPVTAELDSELEDFTLDDELLELPELDDSGTIDIAGDEESALLDISTMDDEEAGLDLTDSAAVETAAAEEDEISLDIDLSDLETDAKDETESEIAAKEASLDMADINFDTDATGYDTSKEAESEEIVMDFNLDDVEVDTAASAAESARTESVAEAVDEEVILDLSDEIDVDSLEMDEVEAVGTAANDVYEDEDDFDLSSLGDVDEVSTKLDLARAYLDMGDNEGTRGILEEVLADGNDEQKQEARDLMAKLG